MINRIISIAFLTFMGVSSAALYLVAVTIWGLTRLIDRRLVILHGFTSFWASIYTWIMPAWHLKIAGREKIAKHKTYVVVSNHQSLLDILVAFRLFFHFKWVSKVEVFKVPFIGWNMVLNRYIKLKRGDAASVRKMFDECEQTLNTGSSVFFFPEGTRSPTGIMKPFKTGAFELAHKLKRPILPIAINGTKNALPKSSINFHGRQDMRITVLDEIPYSAFAHYTPEQTAELVRGVIAAHIDEHREQAAESPQPEA